jgi:hypothetical protein
MPLLLKAVIRYTPFMRTILIVILVGLSSCSNNSNKPVAVDSAAVAGPSLDSASTPLNIDRDNSWKPFVAKYTFNAFPAPKYLGILAEPKFSSVDYGNEKGFKAFIQEHLATAPINFAGKYSIIEKSCGAMCSSNYLIDRQSGRIFSFPKGDGHWGYKYYPNSTLLLANASLVNDSLTGYLDQWGIEPEFYNWTGTAFKRLP